MNLDCSRFSLAGRTALITGASRGIGRELAVALSSAGARVALSGRDTEALGSVASAIQAQGGDTLVLRCDVADMASVTAAFDQLEAQWGSLDILINNAGVEQVCPSDQVTNELWDHLLNTNLKGAFFCSQAAARCMQRSDNSDGAILNLCSLSTAVGIPGSVAYGAAKTGLAGVTRALAAEWASDSIRVNAIAPGYFHTDMTDIFYRDEDWRERMQSAIPMGRFGEAEDLAGPAIFLCSPAARYITGQVLYIDGGYLASI